MSSLLTPIERKPLLERLAEVEPGGTMRRETITLSDNSRRNGKDARDADSIEQPCLGMDLTARALLYSLLPNKPYCSDDVEMHGLLIRKRERAIRFKNVQLNGPHQISFMAHDIDAHNAGYAHRDAYLPPPNVLVLNKYSGTAHAIVILKVPIAKHQAARTAPIKYLAAVEQAYTRRLGADPRYVGLIAKNPFHPCWVSTWLRPDPYDLGELSDWLFRDELRWSPSPQQFNGFSRNCHCFDELRAFAYRVVLEVKLGNGTFHQFEKVLLREANEINCRFDTAMHLSEVVAIVRSISKWVWRKFDPASFSRLQSFRGQKGMRSRWKDCVVASQTKPWLAVGISRATYYRHRAKEKGDSF